MAQKPPVEESIAPLLQKLAAYPRTGLKAGKAFNDELSGEPGDPHLNPTPSVYDATAEIAIAKDLTGPNDQKGAKK